MGGSQPQRRARPIGQVFKQERPYYGMRTPPPVDPLQGHRSPLVPQISRQGVYQIIEEKDDYLIAGGFTPDGGVGFNAAVFIAKPYLLLRTPFHGQTVRVGDLDVTYEYQTTPGERIASAVIDGETVREYQKITEDYRPGDFISAVPMVRGHYRHFGFATKAGEPLQPVDADTGRVGGVDQEETAALS